MNHETMRLLEQQFDTAFGNYSKSAVTGRIHRLILR
jgi:hypothetical protein